MEEQDYLRAIKLEHLRQGLSARASIAVSPHHVGR